MTNLLRVHLDWSGLAVTGVAGTNFYFTEGPGDTQDAVDRVAAFMTELDAQLSGLLVWTVGAFVEHIDVVTGEIQSTEPVTGFTGSGSGSGQALPLATSLIIRSRTGAYVAGREIRGRWFIPGQLEVNNDEGVPTGGVRAAGDNAGAALLPDLNMPIPVVWSPTHGTAAAILSFDTWDQWGSMRSRRD